ncbi:MAG: nucleotidyltransferase domain-containing protein [Synechococcaceae cyanobacterium]
MTTLAAIRKQRRSDRLAALRQGAAAVVAAHANGQVWLFGSLARGDWDAYSDVDLLAIAPSQAAAEALADSLLAARLGDDVLPLSAERWQQLRAGDDPYWQAIGRDALRLDPP